MFSLQFRRQYAIIHAKNIFKKLDELPDRQWLVKYKETFYGCLIKFSYRCHKDSPFTIWFRFEIHTIADVNEMIRKMNKSFEIWNK